MKFWVASSLLALAQASCYDYEYYDPDTGSSIPGNACARAAAAGGASVGQPTTLAAQPQFGVQTQVFGASPIATASAYSVPASTYAPAAPVYGASFTSAAAPVYGASFTSAAAPVYGTSFTSAAPVYTAPVTYSAPAAVYSAPAASVYTSAPVYSAPRPAVATTVYGGVAAAPVYGVAARPAVTTTISAPVYGTSVASYGSATVGARSAAQSDQASQLEYYKRIGERQARQHKQNVKAVQEASQDLSRSSLVNRLVAGTGNAAPWYPAVRLEAQKDAADAYKSEKRIANKNAEDAYRRFQENPSQLNALVSKYQDKNADLKDAAYQYNVVNAATFGQRLATGSILGGLGGLGGGLFGTITQVITNKQQQEDLQDIQRDMQRLSRQIQAEARNVVAQKTGGQGLPVQQGSVQQRMMAMNNYGPQTRSG